MGEATSWLQHVETWKDCVRCPLHSQRSRIVLARGSVPCDVLLVGEAPGISEDTLGIPFVGPAGKLLDGIVELALAQYERTYGIALTTAFANLVACYPREAKEGGWNEPADEEVLACRPRLNEFVRLCRPKLVVTVGKLAERLLDQTILTGGFDSALGRHDRIEVETIAHPVSILRMPVAQRDMATRQCIVTIANAVEELVV